MRAIGKSGARSSGPTGFFVPGCSTGGSSNGRSALMLYQAFGSSESGRLNFVRSGHLSPSLGKGKADSRRNGPSFLGTAAPTGAMMVSSPCTGPLGSRRQLAEAQGRSSEEARGRLK